MERNEIRERCARGSLALHLSCGLLLPTNYRFSALAAFGVSAGYGFQNLRKFVIALTFIYRGQLLNR
jgi:hypothetical protein